MDIQVILIFITFAFALIGLIAVPWLKTKGLWAIALFGVNIIEQVCDFMELQGYGKVKYKFVKDLLLMVSPKLTDKEIDKIIEELVREMNELK